jgi:hypothetical protein
LSFLRPVVGVSAVFAFGFALRRALILRSRGRSRGADDGAGS